MAEEKEIVFYSDDKGVRITNTRAIISNTTYAMANITSVSMGVIQPGIGFQAFLIIAGVLLAGICAAGKAWAGTVIGVIVAALAVWWLTTLKPTYTVQIGSASGSAHAIQSKEMQYIQRVVNAMNEAFIKRG